MPAANNFANDPNCISLWRCESGALGTDSIGTNDLTLGSGTTADTIDYQEGAAAANITTNMHRDDDDLSDNCPLKSTYTGTRRISVTLWFQPAQLPSPEDGDYLFTRLHGWGAAQARYFGINIWTNAGGDTGIWLLKGNLGETIEYEKLNLYDEPLSVGVWYHLGVTYDDATRFARIRLYNADTHAVKEITTTFSKNIKLSGGILEPDLCVNAEHWLHNGLTKKYDEIVLFDDILTAAEIDEIRQGIYNYSSSSSSSSFSSSSSSSPSSSSSDSSSSSFVPLPWPTLSKGVEFETREEPEPGQDIVMPLGNGRPKVRPRYTRRPHRWRVRYRLLTLNDRITLEQFYTVDCKRGLYSCEFTEQGMDQTWLVKFDNRQPPRFSTNRQLPEKYDWEAVLVEDTAGEYGIGKYGAQYYDN